jgi:RNA polymerase sigma-70 factor (ECF subfamily)
MDDRDLVAALRAGEEWAFRAVVTRYQAALTRLALLYAPNRAVAEEAVQETWLAVLRGIDRFEGRSTLRTWLCRILIKRARSLAAREARSLPLSALSGGADGREEDGDRLDQAEALGAVLVNREATPEQQCLAGERSAHLRAALVTLPPNQRAVIRLHDVEGWPAGAICRQLGISEANRRVLLHRARRRVRRELDRRLASA